MIDRNIYIEDRGDQLMSILIECSSVLCKLENRYRLSRGYDERGNPYSNKHKENFLRMEFNSLEEAKNICDKLNRDWIIECVESGRLPKEKWAESDHEYYNSLLNDKRKDERN